VAAGRAGYPGVARHQRSGRPLAEEELSPVPIWCTVMRIACSGWYPISAPSLPILHPQTALDNTPPMTDEMLQAGFDYIQQHREIKDVLLSGGDPLLLRMPTLNQLYGPYARFPMWKSSASAPGIPGVFSTTGNSWPDSDAGPLSPALREYSFQSPVGNHSRIPSCLPPAGGCGNPAGKSNRTAEGVNDDADVLADLFGNSWRCGCGPTTCCR